VTGRLAGPQLLPAPDATHTRPATSRVPQTRAVQLPEPLVVDRLALLLTISLVRSADVRTFVPIEPKPMQILEQGMHECLRRAGLVGVLDAQNEASTHLPCGQEIEERSASVPEVKQTRRAWRETRDYEAGRHVLLRSLIRSVHGG